MKMTEQVTLGKQNIISNLDCFALLIKCFESGMPTGTRSSFDFFFVSEVTGGELKI